ncbi:MAG: hypothetical protein ACRD0K_00080 [Egibacteraceae bacterium]
MVLDDWRQGDVFQYGGQAWVVLSRACDIVKPVDKRSTVMCASSSARPAPGMKAAHRPQAEKCRIPPDTEESCN